MFWTPDLRFAGETVFVVGGGPSLAGFDFSRLAGRRVVAVNSAGHDVPSADILFFHDNSWFEERSNRALADGWGGLVVTVSRHAKLAAPERILRIEAVERPDFPIRDAPVKVGRCSGQTAVSLAVTMGAARVVLIGFDMRATGGATHYHVDRPLYTKEHAERTAGRYADTFLPGWGGWRQAALKAGCSILNATPGSALTEFPTIFLEDVF